MKTPARVEVLVAVRNDARWFPATVIAEHQDGRIDVRLDDGRHFEHAHPDSTRVVVLEEAFR